jgi:NAD(P)H-quinone oxidoreductase subunit 6
MKLNARRIGFYAVATLVVAAFLAYMFVEAIAPAWHAVEAAPSPGLSDVLFHVLAALTIAGALGVALSRNILYSAIGLLTSLLGAGSLYVFLSADFVAVTQLLVYIGGVLVLILFAVMLTNRISEVNVSNTSIGLFGGILLFVAVAPVLLAVVAYAPWPATAPAALASSTAEIGNGLLTKWLLPFEVASLVLLATLIGAVVIARKELKAD